MALMQPEQHVDVHRLLEYCYEQVRRYALAQAAAGADFTAIGDSTAGPDVCSPRIYRQFAHPTKSGCRRPGGARGTTGPPHLRQYHGDHGRYRHHRRDDDRVRLQGRHGALPRGGPKRHARRQRGSQRGDGAGHARAGAPGEPPRLIEALGKNGRFILSPGCTLPVTTPPENVEAMMEAALSFGQYPEDGLTYNCFSRGLARISVDQIRKICVNLRESAAVLYLERCFLPVPKFCQSVSQIRRVNHEPA